MQSARLLGGGFFFGEAFKIDRLPRAAESWLSIPKAEKLNDLP